MDLIGGVHMIDISSFLLWLSSVYLLPLSDDHNQKPEKDRHDDASADADADAAMFKRWFGILNMRFI